MKGYLHSSTLFVLGNLERGKKDFAAARAAYTRAQGVWISGAKIKTHHFSGACMYKLGCVADDLGNEDEAM
jgi:hypothetical protein